MFDKCLPVMGIEPELTGLNSPPSYHQGGSMEAPFRIKITETDGRI